MRAKKRLLSALCLVGGVVFTSSADNKEAIEFYKSNQPGIAKEIFLENLEANASDVDACYYLGEILFSQQKLDSAGLFFDKGLAVDPESALNKIGKAKLLIKNDPQAAQQLFKEILSKKNKKNVSLLLAVAKAYYDNGSDEYKKYVSDAREADRKNPEIYLFEGDVLKDAKKYGEAAASYEQAIYFDNNCTEAYLKYAQLYTEQNQQLAIDMLNKLLAINPNSALALRELGEIYYKGGKFASAAEVYEHYMTLEHNSTRDLVRYASILYYNKAYQKALDVLNTGLEKDPNSVALNRLEMYTLFELKEYDKSLAVAEKLMSVPDQSSLLASDYACYGRLLAQKKEYDKALVEFEKSYQMDSAKLDLYKDLSGAYERTKDYDKAIRFMNRFMKESGQESSTQDLFNLGRIYVVAGMAADSASRAPYMLSADSVFAIVTNMVPDSYLGYLWRAKASSAVDVAEVPQGLAKPHYEKALELLLNDPKGRERLLIECYTYLGVYYLKHDDTAKTKEYFGKVQELDPNDPVAKQVMDGLNK